MSMQRTPQLLPKCVFPEMIGAYILIRSVSIVNVFLVKTTPSLQPARMCKTRNHFVYNQDAGNNFRPVYAGSHTPLLANGYRVGVEAAEQRT